MKLGVVMDPIQTIKPEQDSTLAFLWEAEARAWPIYYFENKDLFLRDGKAYGDARRLKVFRDLKKWFAFEGKQRLDLSELDVILVRTDPPFDQEYLYLTQLLDVAERAGVLVANKPQSLRDCNEKLTIERFPQCCVPNLVTSKMELLREFWEEQKDIVCKPLHAMGGQSVFHLRPDEANAAVIFETLTQLGTRKVMAQRFIAEIKHGDKRIILINGEAVPYALTRLPQAGDWRGNMSAGAKPVAQLLSERDAWICQQLGPFLRERGLYFVGIDIIGDYLTEINVTSPTGVRELDAQAKLNVSAQFLDCLVSLRTA